MVQLTKQYILNIDDCLMKKYKRYSKKNYFAGI